ncbi:immunoglobulin alpha-2 heavy chain-like isoform X2 [Anguilla anguilla]|uniref:immunoglobulin alpha-2 heavy chain-like isoform X2 n=1 Tax=Anguilla anguilla TaxID=7936 RepID=UPI0015ABF78D|nr:immunoglobulin alpha-2 heavy chain-like isoform X2 [Anguilla anguilla]
MREDKMRAWLLILYYIYALKAQDPVVVQSPERVLVEDGGIVSLQCSLKVVGSRCYTVIWMKTDPRTKMLSTLPYPNTDMGANGGKGPTCFFTIKNATVQDSGIYYCSVVFGTMTYFGSGSTVIVTQATENRTKPPPVEILWPRSVTPRIPLLCVISGVVPSQVRVFWVIDGEEDSGLTESLWTKDSDGIVESTLNQILVSAEEWERGVLCTCVVEFAGMNISKSVQNQGSSDVCTLLLYGIIAGTGLTIIVAISIAVFLHGGCSVKSDGNAREQRRETGLDHRQHRSEREGGRRSGIDQTTTGVLYASLEEASLARRT